MHGALAAMPLRSARPVQLHAVPLVKAPEEVLPMSQRLCPGLHRIIWSPQQLPEVNAVIPIAQVRKVRLGEAELLMQSCTTGDGRDGM